MFVDKIVDIYERRYSGQGGQAEFKVVRRVVKIGLYWWGPGYSMCRRSGLIQEVIRVCVKW